MGDVSCNVLFTYFTLHPSLKVIARTFMALLWCIPLCTMDVLRWRVSRWVSLCSLRLGSRQATAVGRTLSRTICWRWGNGGWYLSQFCGKGVLCFKVLFQVFFSLCFLKLFVKVLFKRLCWGFLCYKTFSHSGMEEFPCTNGQSYAPLQEGTIGARPTSGPYSSRAQDLPAF